MKTAVPGPRWVNVHKHTHVWPVNKTQMSSVPDDGQNVYTNGWRERERESTQQGPDGRLALERGHSRSCRVVVVMWTWHAVDAEGGYAAGVAVPQPTRGKAVVNQSRSPTLPLASLPGRKNSLVKIMVSFWLLTFEQGGQI